MRPFDISCICYGLYDVGSSYICFSLRFLELPCVEFCFDTPGRIEVSTRCCCFVKNWPNHVVYRLLILGMPAVMIGM